MSEPDFSHHVLIREKELPVTPEEALMAGYRAFCKPRR